MCNHNLEGKYEPNEFEEKIYKNWEKKDILNQVEIKKKVITA